MPYGALVTRLPTRADYFVKNVPIRFVKNVPIRVADVERADPSPRRQKLGQLDATLTSLTGMRASFARIHWSID